MTDDDRTEENYPVIESVSKYYIELRGDRYIDPQEVTDRLRTAFAGEVSVRVEDYDDHQRRSMRR